MRSNHLDTTLGFEQDMKNAMLLGLPVKNVFSNPHVCEVCKPSCL